MYEWPPCLACHGAYQTAVGLLTWDLPQVLVLEKAGQALLAPPVTAVQEQYRGWPVPPRVPSPVQVVVQVQPELDLGQLPPRTQAQWAQGHLTLQTAQM
jgi:hypothetical protein